MFSGMFRIFRYALLGLSLAGFAGQGGAKTLDYLPDDSTDISYLATISKALDAGAFGRAEELLRARLESVPDDAIAWEVLGVALALQGQVAAADEAYEKATDLDPNRLSAWVKRGDLAEASGDLATAQTHWSGALAVRPTYAAANERLGRALAATQDFERAIPYFETVIATEDPDALGVKAELALIYNQQGRARDTLALLAPWAKTTAEPQPAALLALGNAHVQLNAIDSALLSYERGLAAAPDNMAIARALGALLVQQGEMTRAAELLSGPASATPVDAFAALNYGQALASLGQYPEAVVAARQAADATNDTGLKRQALALLSRSHLLNNARAEAVSAAASVVDLAPEDVTAWRDYIAIVAAVGEYQQAVGLYDQTLTRFPADAPLLRGRSLAYIRLGNLEAAAADAEAAAKAAPDWIEPRFLMGEIASAQGKDWAADKAFRSVLNIAPDHWPSLLKLARLAQKEGVLDEAETFAQRAVAASGNAPAAQEALTEIREQLSNQ